MALLGFPLAQENDAERAARAALSIQRALEIPQASERSGRPLNHYDALGITVTR